VSEIPQQDGPPPSENGAEPGKKKRTCLVCCCIGCFVGFLTIGAITVFYSALLLEFFRSLIVPK
jgi:hypothetical protein